jgi:hypothetical protein
MINKSAITAQADRYVRGNLDVAETAAFESEMLESPEVQNAVEVALGLRRAFEFERELPGAQVVPLHAAAAHRPVSLSRWPAWAMAASVSVAAVAGTLLWRSEAENALLHSRLAELNRPVETVLSVPLDVMRSAGPRAPDVRIRKPAGAALLVLDVEVAAPLLDAGALNLALIAGQGQALLNWSAKPGPDGRLKVALRSEQLPDGILELRMNRPGLDVTDVRLLELLPAR